MAPTKCQSIDEHMIKFKGHNILCQYVKGKPIKWGYKMWCRCDSKTGYLFQFDLYLGKKTNEVEKGLGEGVVLHLTQELENLFCQVYIDNFFKSPALQVELLSKNTYSVGTYRPNRKHLPKDKLPDDAKMKKGDVIAFEANGVNFVKWMDNKAVYMLSNCLSAYPLQTIKRRKKGSKESDTVVFPLLVKSYNEYMGGVDITDQKKVTYQFSHKSHHKYYLRIVYDLIDISINNAYVVYEKLNEGNKEKLDLKSYRQLIACSLIGTFTNRKRSFSAAPIETAKRLKAIQIHS